MSAQHFLPAAEEVLKFAAYLRNRNRRERSSTPELTPARAVNWIRFCLDDLVEPGRYEREMLISIASCALAAAITIDGRETGNGKVRQ
jgi:hypothetical protein